MAEVLFYHLTRSPLEATLPELLEKTLARGWRALVRGRRQDHLEWLDERLWVASDDGFLPHGLAGGAHDAAQPVLLTTAADNPNKADLLFLVDGAAATMDELGDFTRACILFDGNDEAALNDARAFWKQVVAAGLPAKYWSQESGRWQQKASSG